MDQQLLNYLTQRKINLEFAKKFCFQVYYSFNNKKEHYGIGFMNNSGGIDIRNIFSSKYGKICLGKKEITTINNSSDVVSLFESWSDFLSYLTLKNTIPNKNFILLNSTSLVKKAFELLDNYSKIKLFFDNDSAGDKATEFLIQNIKIKSIDNRVHYKNYKDLNEFLIGRKNTE